MLMVTSWWKLMVTSCHIMLWESLDAVGHFSHDENPLVSCWWPNSEADAYNQVTSEICNGTFRFKQKETKARRYRVTFRVCLLLFFFLPSCCRSMPRKSGKLEMISFPLLVTLSLRMKFASYVSWEWWFLHTSLVWLLSLVWMFTRLSASSAVSVRVSRGRKVRRERLGVRNQTSRSEVMPRRVGLFAVPFP